MRRLDPLAMPPHYVMLRTPASSRLRLCGPSNPRSRATHRTVSMHQSKRTSTQPTAASRLVVVATSQAACACGASQPPHHHHRAAAISGIIVENWCDGGDQGEERQVREEDGVWVGVGPGVGRSFHERDKLCFRSTSTPSAKMSSRRRAEVGVVSYFSSHTVHGADRSRTKSTNKSPHHCQRLIHKTQTHSTMGEGWWRANSGLTAPDTPTNDIRRQATPIPGKNKQSFSHHSEATYRVCVLHWGPASAKTPNGPFWWVLGFEISMQEPNFEHVSWFGPSFWWKKKLQSVSLQKTLKSPSRSTKNACRLTHRH